jgi:hypothetical protein
MHPLESGTISIMEFTDTRTVYGSDVTIPNDVLRYSDHPLNGKPVSERCRAFHAKLVELGIVPRALQQRYGVNIFETFCDPAKHPSEYIQTADIDLLRDAMERAVDALLIYAKMPEGDFAKEAA